MTEAINQTVDTSNQAIEIVKSIHGQAVEAIAKNIGPKGAPGIDGKSVDENNIVEVVTQDDTYYTLSDGSKIQQILFMHMFKEYKGVEPEDFFKSETAEKWGINNLPKTEKESKNVIANLQVVADKIQTIRNLLNQPIKILRLHAFVLVRHVHEPRYHDSHYSGVQHPPDCI